MNWNLTDNNNSERFRHTNYGASSFKLSENTFFIIIIRLVDCFQILFFLINNDSKIIVIAKRYHIIFWNVHFSRNVISFFRKNSVSNGSFYSHSILRAFIFCKKKNVSVNYRKVILEPQCFLLTAFHEFRSEWVSTVNVILERLASRNVHNITKILITFMSEIFNYIKVFDNIVNVFKHTK